MLTIAITITILKIDNTTITITIMMTITMTVVTPWCEWDWMNLPMGISSKLLLLTSLSLFFK